MKAFPSCSPHSQYSLWNQIRKLIQLEMQGSIQENSQVRCAKVENNRPSSPNHNGFTHSPTLTQILPLLLVVIIVGLSITQAHLSLRSTVVIVVFDGLICALMMATSVLWYLATKIIPTDSIQLRHLDAIAKGEEFNSKGNSSHCQVCQTNVNKHSFHCKKCERCVEYFDHHCKWLNNCIGAKNYFEFFGLIVLVLMLFLVCCALNAFVLQNNSDRQGISFVLAIVILVLAGSPSLWLMYLVSLHAYIIITKRSTLELIMENRRKNQIHPSNNTKAVQSGNKIIKFQLEAQKASKINDSTSLRQTNKVVEEASGSETNQILIRENLSEKESVEKSLIESKQAKTLPPVRTKYQYSSQLIKKNPNKAHLHPKFIEGS